MGILFWDSLYTESRLTYLHVYSNKSLNKLRVITLLQNYNLIPNTSLSCILLN